MLGVRRFKGTQIDIWQGDITKFAADLSVSAPRTSPSGGAPDGLRLAWLDVFIGAQKTGGRHVTIDMKAGIPAALAMQAAKDFLETRVIPSGAKTIQRITFVASTMPLYDELQESLFATFEDLDHEV